MPEQEKTLPKKTVVNPTLPWPYVTLNPDIIMQNAYNNYYLGGCMYATGKALTEALVNSVGAPWDNFNPDFFQYGSGGIAGQGTLCGALNAAAAIIQLAAPSGYSVILNELFNWYRNFPFPSARMDRYSKFTNQPVTTSKSLLCNHSSVKWADSLGFGLDSSERKDRCAKLAGDVAHKTVELLNAWNSGTFKQNYTTADFHSEINFESCFNCHIEKASTHDSNTDKVNCSSPIGAVCANSDAFAAGTANSIYTTFPWPYITLDTEVIRKRAYEGYYTVGCMYGVASALTNTMKETVGSPWDSVPVEIFNYGSAGVGSWGTVCGALNGACWVIQATAGPNVNKVIELLFDWYCNTGLPSRLMDKYCQFPNQKTTVSNSPLCYVSASNWSYTNRIPINGAERKDRCAKVAGDVAAKTAELLNALRDDTGILEPVLPEDRKILTV